MKGGDFLLSRAFLDNHVVDIHPLLVARILLLYKVHVNLIVIRKFLVYIAHLSTMVCPLRRLYVSDSSTSPKFGPYVVEPLSEKLIILALDHSGTLSIRAWILQCNTPIADGALQLC